MLHATYLPSLPTHIIPPTTQFPSTMRLADIKDCLKTDCVGACPYLMLGDHISFQLSDKPCAPWRLLTSHAFSLTKAPTLRCYNSPANSPSSAWLRDPWCDQGMNTEKVKMADGSWEMFGVVVQHVWKLFDIINPIFTSRLSKYHAAYGGLCHGPLPIYMEISGLRMIIASQKKYRIILWNGNCRRKIYVVVAVSSLIVMFIVNHIKWTHS